jgi:hypothetical protein
LVESKDASTPSMGLPAGPASNRHVPDRATVETSARCRSPSLPDPEKPGTPTRILNHPDGNVVGLLDVRTPRLHP